MERDENDECCVCGRPNHHGYPGYDFKDFDSNEMVSVLMIFLSKGGDQRVHSLELLSIITGKDKAIIEDLMPTCMDCCCFFCSYPRVASVLCGWIDENEGK